MLRFDYGPRILDLLASLFPIPWLKLLAVLLVYLAVLWFRIRKLKIKVPSITFFSNNPSYPFISTFHLEVLT